MFFFQSGVVSSVINIKLNKLATCWRLQCKMSRVIAAVKPHVPLIKFPTRLKWTPKLQEPKTPYMAQPVQHTPIAPDTIEVFRVVPARFRRRPADIEELEFIQRGGPE